MSSHSLHEAVESILAQGDYLGASFVIAGVLRSTVQGEASTFEGECASLVKASELFDLDTEAGVRAWLADLGRLPDIQIPDSQWSEWLAAWEAEDDGSL